MSLTKANNNSLKSFDPIILCFSAKRNIQSIFSAKQHKKLKAMDGMRSFLSVWVVLMHTYMGGFLMIHVRNFYLSATYKATKNYRNMIVPNYLAMDNFMFISG